MSTTSTTYFHSSVAADAGRSTSNGKTGTQGFFSRVIEARTRRGEASVAAYFARQSDSTLAGLGFTLDEIASIRANGRIPASFWRR